MEVVTVAVGILLDKLAELLKEEYGLQQGVREKIESLSRELNMVHAVLREVGDVPWHRLDTPTKLWVGELREASYDMEDIVDAFLVRHGTEPPDPRRRKPFGKKVSELWNQMWEFWARREISTKIQDLSKKLEELALMRSKYKLDSDITNSAAATTIDPRILGLHKKATELEGIEGSKNELINMLSLGGNVDVPAEKMKIVTVVGLGGLGKTTLAKAVYDQFKPRFECGAFVPVGLKPCMKKVLRDILIGLDGETYRKPEWDVLDVYQLIDKLKEFVREKRCFLVIDDIWDRKSWEYIRCALQESNCSRVVITTRIDEVATHAGEVYRIKKLSHENSKKLLYARISDGGGKYFGSPSSSEACDRILKKCDGVPLAIITIASVLASKPEQHWDEVNNFISVGREDNDEMSNTRTILSFSYYDLPSHLKPCLLYLSVFPEDHVIEKNRLIWMWTAEGFIHGEQAAREGLFDLGERYFNELINRNMIQAEEEEGYVYGCRVHDMVLDLIRSLSSEQNFVTVLEQEQQRLPVSIIPRRLALQHAARHNGGSQLANINNVHKLRSLIGSRGELGSACKPIPCLRVLHMESCDVEGMLEYLGSLLQLRYLRLPCINKLLLGQVRYLKCLRTLDLRGIAQRELPDEVGLLTQLVCLRVSWIGMRVPAGLIGRLTSLQELSMDSFFSPDDLMQFVKELGMLRELRVLRTQIWDRSESVVKALLESLGNMHNIRTVHIESGIPSSPDKNSGMSHAGFISLRHLQYLYLTCIVFSGLLVSLPPNLCYLRIEVRYVKEQDMEALARLPELCRVDLEVHSPDAELLSIKTPIGAGYFRKLRFLRLRIVEASIWFDLHASECSSSSRVASIIMPSLESLEFYVHVRSLKDATRLGYDDKLLGFENLGRTSLQRVFVHLWCTGARISEVEEVVAVLVDACRVHPKHPTLKTDYLQETKMLSPYQEASDMNIANKAWNLATIIDSGDIRALHMPDPAISSCKVMRLRYTKKLGKFEIGRSLLALSSNAVHKLWKWERSDRNPLGMARRARKLNYFDFSTAVLFACFLKTITTFC